MRRPRTPVLLALLSAVALLVTGCGEAGGGGGGGGGGTAIEGGRPGCAEPAGGGW